MENIKLIISVGVFNDCLNEINLVDEYKNSVLCYIFDKQDRLPDKYIYGKPLRSILYNKLELNYTNYDIEIKKEPKTFFDFIKREVKTEIKKEKIYDYENFICIEQLINNNEDILLLYTDEYLGNIIKLIKKCKLENIKIIKKQS
jgi:hypothetical protein